MEDAVVAECIDATNPTFCFAVFDGHGGDFCARWAARELPRRLRLHHHGQQKHDQQAQRANHSEVAKRSTSSCIGTAINGDGHAKLNGSNHLSMAVGDPKDPPDLSKETEAMISETLLSMDADLKLQSRSWSCGTTAVVALVSRTAITVANLGDSRAVLCRNKTAQPLSHDHKPTDEGERLRITRAGAQVIDARVNGDLALSRALGDFRHKAVPNLAPSHQPVSSVADVCTTRRIINSDGFLLIACDGVWDVLSSEDAVR